MSNNSKLNAIITKLYYYKVPSNVTKRMSFVTAICGAIYGMHNLSSKSNTITEAFFSGITGAATYGAISGGLTYVVVSNLPIILCCLSIALPWGIAGICAYKHKHAKNKN